MVNSLLGGKNALFVAAKQLIKAGGHIPPVLAFLAQFTLGYLRSSLF